MAMPPEEYSIDEIAPRIPWELFQRTEDPAGLRLEYEDGRVLVSPTGSLLHNLLRDLLTVALVSYRRTRPTGELFIVSEHSCFMPRGTREYRPDLTILTGDRARPPLREPGYTDGAPTIAIEVLSPSTRKRDLGLKARRYFEQGTREYWTLDPLARTATFRRRSANGWETITTAGEPYTTPLLPMFTLDLAGLWQELSEVVGDTDNRGEEP